MIDLRSDTVTKPTPGMLAAMTAAAVGDDVFGEDPTVNELERAHRGAVRQGSRAVRAVGHHVEPDRGARPLPPAGRNPARSDEPHLPVGRRAARRALSGVTCRTIDGQIGLLAVADLEGKVRPDDMHSVRTRLVCLENTHNRGGGTVLSARSGDRRSHPGRARTGWRCTSTAPASGTRWWRPASRPRSGAEHFDTVSVCFSKGLGAPVGSALLGPQDLIAHARRIRKLFGGAMRQAGLPRGGVPLRDGPPHRPAAEDHANARLIADAVARVPGLTLTPPRGGNEPGVVRGGRRSSAPRRTWRERLKANGVLVAALGKNVIRAVTHLDVTREQCEKAAEAIRRLAG